MLYTLAHIDCIHLIVLHTLAYIDCIHLIVLYTLAHIDCLHLIVLYTLAHIDCIHLESAFCKAAHYRNPWGTAVTVLYIIQRLHLP